MGFEQAVLLAIAAVVAIILHEVSHGYAARVLGDDTAQRAGRLSLNPLRHIDRVGTILVPGLLLLVHAPFMFGWAKPVPVSAFKFRNPRRGMALVALAGPAMNFFLAWVAALLLLLRGVLGAVADQFLFFFILTNLTLGLFNLLPIPPLDGGRIAVGILPLDLARRWARLERVGMLLVVVLLLLPHIVPGVDPLGDALETVVPWAVRLVLRLAGHDVSESDVHL